MGQGQKFKLNVTVLVLLIGWKSSMNVSGLLIPLQGVRVGSVGKMVKPLLSVVM